MPSIDLKENPELKTTGDLYVYGEDEDEGWNKAEITEISGHDDHCTTLVISRYESC